MSAVAINFATLDQLQTIPGVKEKLARAILSVRENSGNITPDVLLTLTRGKIPYNVIDNIDFTFDEALADEEDSLFETLESTVKKDPSEGLRAPWGGAASLFASAHKASENFGTLKGFTTPSKEDIIPDMSSSYSMKKPIPPTAAETPRVTHGDLDNLIGQLRKAQEIISLTSFPDVRTKPAESGLTHQATSASYLSRPDAFAGVTVPTLEPKIPVSRDGNFARNFTVPERQRLQFEDRSNPQVPKPAPTVSFDLGEPAVSDIGGIAPMPDMRAIERQRKHTMDVMKALPKGLIFDWKSNWFAFKHKFSLYASQLGWTPEDCFNCLCWSLTGKAADFYAILLEQKHTLNYRQLLNKLESRFGAKELPATAQGLFQQATQAPRETLEDWADRIMTLATRAFKDLPEHYSNSQAVVRFCQGLTDKEAGHHVCIQEPKSMEQALNGIKWYQYVHKSMYTGTHRDSQSHEYDEPANIYQVSETPTRGGAESFSASPQLANLQEEIRDIKSELDQYVNESNRETTAVRSVSEPARKPLVSNGENRLDSMEGKIDKLQNAVQKLLKLAQPRPQHYRGGNYRRDKAPGRGGRDWIKDEECFACGEKGHFAKDCMTVQAPQGYNDLNHRGSGVGANPRPSHQDNTREFPVQPNLREIRAQPILRDFRGVGSPEACQFKSVNQISISRDANEVNLERLVEDHLTSIESANSFGRLLPAREVVDQLGHCRRHNFDRRDEALLGQVRLARGRLDNRWIKVATREARSKNVWDHDWIRQHMHNPDARLQAGRVQRPNREERSEDQARPSSSTCSPVRFPRPEGRVEPPPVARVLSVGSSQCTTSQPSVVSTSQGTNSRPSVSTSQGTTSSKSLVLTVRGTGSNTSMSSGPHHGGGRRARQRRRRRRRRQERTGNKYLEKAPKFETVVRPREQQMRVEMPLLDSSGPTIAPGSSGAQCPIPNCSGDGSKRHAFECHLPAIFREELHGQEITVRRIGALSMIASWLLGDRATQRSLANYYHLMDVSTTFDESVTQDQQRAMIDMCIEMETKPPSSFVLSQAGNEEWVLVHWQVVLRLLARVQPLNRLQPLCDLYRLTPEEEVLLQSSLLALDSHWRDMDQMRYSGTRVLGARRPDPIQCL